MEVGLPCLRQLLNPNDQVTERIGKLVVGGHEVGDFRKILGMDCVYELKYDIDGCHVLGSRHMCVFDGKCSTGAHGLHAAA